MLAPHRLLSSLLFPPSLSTLLTTNVITSHPIRYGREEIEGKMSVIVTPVASRSGRFNSGLCWITP
ncbi:hypothetical protein OPV22_017671 [Ensete ventricosum]|uniref:Secreted protein n=1 Tax=Ensete ventricosum TaxID=4639 RepID=A0AAV8PF61_ENSVE|nr:hypothetical protein OPV22_017671 [Ensete ventricosum]